MKGTHRRRTPPACGAGRIARGVLHMVCLAVVATAFLCLLAAGVTPREGVEASCRMPGLSGSWGSGAFEHQR